jgi:hypothetical protein
MAVVAVGTVVALAIGIYSLVSIHAQATEQERRANEAQAAYDEACVRLVRAGFTCPVNPADLKGDPGEQGRQGEPGRPPTEAEILAAVQIVYRNNPPKDGRPPTAEEIAAQVTAYLVANPPAKGEKGDTGEQGPGPTAEQILAAVNAWMAEHPLPYCPSGSHIEEYNPLGDRRTFLVCTKDEPSPSPAAR